LNHYTPVFDINDNHVSFDFANITTSAAANASAILDLGNEGTFYAWVEYDRDTKLLELRISLWNARPPTALLAFNVNLFDVVEEYMWVGFSASGGARGEVRSLNYFIGAWAFESSGLPEPPVSSSLSNGGKSGNTKMGVNVGISVGIPALLLGGLIITFFVRRKFCKARQGAESTRDDLLIDLEGVLQTFAYKHLFVATNGFSEASKLGHGGFGSVYCGVLPESGKLAAMKKISSNSSQGEREFMAEVKIISQLRHRNLIQLIRWCSDAAEQKYLLV
jgi:hypothetical protein